MELILVLLEMVALAAASALCIYLIVVLRRVRVLLAAVEQDLHQVKTRALPVLDNLQVITEKVRSITESIGDQVETMRESLGSLRKIVENVLSFEERVQAEIEEPVLETVAKVADIFKAVTSLLERIPFLSKLLA
jgi:uncharacterized protein YoxC